MIKIAKQVVIVALGVCGSCKKRDFGFHVRTKGPITILMDMVTPS